MPTEVSTPNGNGFKVLRLESSNVKALKAVDITPDPNSPLVVIGGNNGQGKTSVLDSIMYALGGKDAVCADPIRHGQKKAAIKVDIGKYTVTRRFSPAGQTLEVKTKEGLNVASPQGTLDAILGSLTFDPLAFSRMAPAKRLATLISLVKLDIDLNDLATKRKALFDSRTDLNRRRRDYEGELRQKAEPDASLPNEKVDVSALVAEKNAREAVCRANGQERHKLEVAKKELADCESRVENLKRRIAELQAELADAEHDANLQHRTVVVQSEKVVALIDPETASLDAQIQDASDINTKIDRAAEYRERQKKLGTMNAQYDQLSGSIESLDQAKEDALSRAAFPIPGLSFADGDVQFNETLFDQLSSAEQVKVSLAMAMAMNPALKVIMIRDGSLLDETSLGIIRELAHDRGYQIWMEVVGNRADATVIIEDGAVVGADVTEPEVEGALDES